MGTQAKLVPNAKYGVTMTELHKMRVTPEQKTLLSLASASADVRYESDFWREYNVYSAELILKLKAEEITVDECGELLANYIEENISATVEQDTP